MIGIVPPQADDGGSILFTLSNFLAGLVVMTAAAITRIQGKAAHDFGADFVKRCRPAILSNAAQDWQALSTWSFGYLKEVVGAKPAIIGGVKLQWQGKRLTIAEFIELVFADTPPADLPYLRAASIPAFYPELIADLQPALAHSRPNRMTARLLSRRLFGHPDGKLGYPELFIGAPGRGTPLLHYDVGWEHTFITQIIGDKEFYLFAPDQGQFLYPNELQSNQSNILDLPDPDVQKFPLFANAEMKHVTLRAGETLFIPCGWWHMSHLLMPSVSISMNSVSAVNWRRFCDYRLSQVRRPYRRRALRLYLKLLGPLLGIAERLGFGSSQTNWG
jgi:histone arginine demethylase JMJD6